MKFELKDFQVTSARGILDELDEARVAASKGKLQAVVLSAPTGSGKTITVAAKVSGVALPSRTFDTAGEHTYEVDVPASALSPDLVNVEFSLDRVIPPDQGDGRELGVVVTSVGLAVKR